MEVLYTKYSNRRAPQFATVTQVIEDGGKKYVVKRAQTHVAQPHIDALVKNRELLSRIYDGIADVCPVTLKDGVAYFDYIDGERFDTALGNAIKKNDISRVNCLLDTLIMLVKGVNNEPVSFEYTHEFWEIFGDIEIPDGTFALPITNMGVMPSSIIIGGDKPVLTDCEWAFDFPIPLDFVIYRVLKTVYSANNKMRKDIFTFEELCERYGVTLSAYVLKLLDARYERYLFGESAEDSSTDIFNSYKKPALREWPIEFAGCDIGNVKVDPNKNAAVSSTDSELVRVQADLNRESLTRTSLEAQLNVIQNSRSWRIASGLSNTYKAIKNPFKKLAGTYTPETVITGERDIVWTDKNGGSKSDRVSFSVDEMRLQDGRLILRGWLFADDEKISSIGAEITGNDCPIRTKINYPIVRDDVAAVTNKPNAEKCGFNDVILAPVKKPSKLYFTLKSGGATVKLYINRIYPA